MVFSLPRLGHDIFRRADERDAAGGERARVGAGRVRHQLRHAGPRRAGHDALRRRDQQGLLPGRLGRPPQLCQSQHQQVGARANIFVKFLKLLSQVGAVRGGVVGRAVRGARLPGRLHQDHGVP